MKNVKLLMLLTVLIILVRWICFFYCTCTFIEYLLVLMIGKTLSSSWFISLMSSLLIAAIILILIEGPGILIRKIEKIIDCSFEDLLDD